MMNGVTRGLSFVMFGTLAWASSSGTAAGQLAEERSVPEPTQLQAVATAAGSERVWAEVLGEIRSADAGAEVSAIEVLGPIGDRVRGLRISLEDTAASDQIYIPESLISSFRDELREIEFTRQQDSECRATYRCIHGIARCRPSQTETQAYCPGRFSTPTSEGGLVLSTPRNTFSFPAVDAARLDALVGEAAERLETRPVDDEATKKTF